MSLLDSAIAGLATSLKSLAGTSVVFHRKGQRLTLTGVRTVKTYEVLDAATHMPMLVEYTDWLFTAADLVLNGEPVTLTNGDELLVGDETYVVRPADKKSVTEPHDAAGLMIVVHTKKDG